MKQLWLVHFHDEGWPWDNEDRSILIYNVATLNDGEPDWTGGASERKIPFSSTNATTRLEMRQAAFADAIAQGFMTLEEAEAGGYVAP